MSKVVERAVAAINGLLDAMTEEDRAAVARALLPEAHRPTAFDRINAATSSGRTQLENVFASAAAELGVTRDKATQKISIVDLDKAMTAKHWSPERRMAYKTRLRRYGVLASYEDLDA